MQLFANVMLVLGIIALVIVSTYSMIYQLIHGNGGQHPPFVPMPPEPKHRRRKAKRSSRARLKGE
jgi:hypothetical protein